MMVRMAKGQAYLCCCSVVRRLCTSFNVLYPSLNKKSECKHEEGLQGGRHHALHQEGAERMSKKQMIPVCCQCCSQAVHWVECSVAVHLVHHDVAC